MSEEKKETKSLKEEDVKNVSGGREWFGDPSVYNKFCSYCNKTTKCEIKKRVMTCTVCGQAIDD